MFMTVSKLSAPIAGALLLATIGYAGAAPAMPQAANLKFQPAPSELVVEVDHRGKNGRNGHRRHGWDNGWGYHEMGPRQIRRSLRHRGFHKIRILDRRGPMYIVKARAWGGQKFRLVVDSRTAQIVRSRPLGRGHRHGPYWQGRWY
ncbi:hypothetical protein CHH27_16355 [Labrenzia sp. VG12]|nr:hypothetical protein CHH27_16355 [Labrenzia sp. VG12]